MLLGEDAPVVTQLQSVSAGLPRGPEELPFTQAELEAGRPVQTAAVGFPFLRSEPTSEPQRALIAFFRGGLAGCCLDTDW